MRKIKDSADRFLAGTAILIVCLVFIFLILHEAFGLDLRAKNDHDRTIVLLVWAVLIIPFVVGAIKIGDWLFKPKPWYLTKSKKNL